METKKLRSFSFQVKYRNLHYILHLADTKIDLKLINKPGNKS